MHKELTAEPSEDPDSPDPEPRNNAYFDNNGKYFVVKFKSGEASVSLLDKRWTDIFHLIDMGELRSIVEETFRFTPHPVSPLDCSITFAIVASDDAHMCQLNGNFRRKPFPTNVLSFPDGTFDEIEGEQHLGDIFLGFETIKSEAIKRDVPIRNHLLHLIVHGLLHLLGYDHEEDGQAHIMEQNEASILNLFNIPDPY